MSSSSIANWDMSLGDTAFLYPFLGQEKQETERPAGGGGGVHPDESA